MQVVAAWIIGAVFITAWVSSPDQAVQLATKVMSLTGVTAGAIVGGADDMFAGFNQAKDASNAPAPKKSNGPASTAPRVNG